MNVTLVLGLLVFSLNCFAGNNTHLERAKAYFETRQYADAAKYFELAIRRDTTVEVLSQLAVCYLRLNDPIKAEMLLGKIVQKDSSEASIFEDYAALLKMNEKAALAKGVYAKMGRLFPDKLPECKIREAYCDSILIWKSVQRDYRVMNLQEINSPYSEISPVVTENTLVFASNREGVIIQAKSQENNLPFFDFYKSKLVKDSILGTPMAFSEFINSIHHEVAASFSTSGKHIYFAQTKNLDKIPKDSVNRPKLYRSEKNNGVWSKPETFIFNDSTYSFSQPCIDKEEKMFFFASDIKGGFGGLDIYLSLNINDKWTDPINLGPIINSPGNEIYPFYDSTGTLFFSSDYHLGIGGYDIFRAIQENGDFVRIENLKSPINSSSNDFGVFYDPMKRVGYFASDRRGGKGKEDIYFFYHEPLIGKFNEKALLSK